MPQPIELTEEEYHDLNRAGGIGVCLACREVDAQDGYAEPDAEDYLCALCGEHAVAGLELALVMGEIEIIDDDD